MEPKFNQIRHVVEATSKIKYLDHKFGPINQMRLVLHNDYTLFSFHELIE